MYLLDLTEVLRLTHHIRVTTTRARQHPPALHRFPALSPAACVAQVPVLVNPPKSSLIPPPSLSFRYHHHPL